MEIIIDEYEARVETSYNFNFYTRSYWGTEPGDRKFFKLNKVELNMAQSNGSNYVEILVKKIRSANEALLSHSFKKLPKIKGRFLRRVEFDRVIDQRNFTSVVGCVEEFGPKTVFRFRYPIAKLLQLPALWEELDKEWFYTLGEDDNGTVFLLLLLEGAGWSVMNGLDPGVVPMAGPPPSHGVKVPGGHVQ